MKAPNHVGSNFHEAVLTVGPAELALFPALARTQPLLADGKTRTFASMSTEFCGFPASWLTFRAGSEHLGQCRKALDLATLDAFTTTGRFGLLTQEAFEAMGFSPLEASKKLVHWTRKLNIGIVAKMAVHPSRSASLGLHLSNVEGNEPGREEETWHWWLAVVSLKARQSVGFRIWLLGVPATSYLCEFDRSATRQPDQVFWGGCFDKQRPRVLYGRNVMGRILMRVRTRQQGLLM